MIAELGVLQLTPFTRACLAIANGELDVAIVVRWRGEVPRPARHDHRNARRSTRCRPTTSRPTSRSVPPTRSSRRPSAPPGSSSAPLHVLGARDRAAVRPRRVGARENARATAELWAAVQPRGRVESRRVAARPGGARVPRAPVGQEPDARGAVHQVALLAVERRPGRRVRALLHRGRRPRRRARRTGACTRVAAVESNHMLAVSRRAAAPPGAGGAHRRRARRRPHRDRRGRRATSSTSTAASRRRCASRPRELGLPLDDPTAARSASAAG